MDENNQIYCLKCKKQTDTLNSVESKSKNKKLMLKGKCKICNTNKSKFIPKVSKNIIPENIIPIENKAKSVLEKAYYDPKTGYSGINDLQRKTGLPQKEVKEFLNQQDTYTLHKPARRNFKTERVYIHNIDEQWQADLVEMIPYSKENDDFKYLLTVIDCFSKFAWGIPIKNKSGDETLKAFELIFKQKHDNELRIPAKLQTDKGKEFFNPKLNKLFKKT